MNAMTLALATAGVAVPTIKERVWRIIKSQPGITANQICRAMPAVPPGSISSQLSLLEKAELVYIKGTKGKGTKGTAKAYYTDHDAFVRPDRWPSNSAKNGTKPAPIVYAPLTPAPLIKPAAKPSPIDIESLTLAEARAVYNQLKEIFG